MSCTVTISYDALPISGTPSQGSTLLNQTYDIAAPNGDFIGEIIPDGTEFSACPSVTQYLFRARNPKTGEIVGSVRSSTCHNIVFKGYVNSCPPLPNDSDLPHDCINGACIKKSVYGTPGLYKSLSECEIACGTGCSGKCISNDDWAQIEGLSNQLKSRNCS
jgi:hypothetical protein